MAGLAVLVLSDRIRQRIHRFVSRHFGKARHDSGRIWTEFSWRLANVKDRAGLCAASARLISETFDVLSVTIWLLDEQKEQLVVGASTARQPGETAAGKPPESASSAVVAGLQARSSPFDLEERERALGRGTAAAELDDVPERRPPLVCSAASRGTERGRSGSGRPRQWRALHVRGAGAAAVHRPPGDVGAAEPAAGRRGGAGRGAGGVPDDVGVLRARPEERGRLAQPDAEEPAGALRRPGVS